MKRMDESGFEGRSVILSNGLECQVIPMNGIQWMNSNEWSLEWGL